MTGVSAGVQAPPALALPDPPSLSEEQAASTMAREANRATPCSFRERNSIRAPFDRPGEPRRPWARPPVVRSTETRSTSLTEHEVPRNTGSASGGPVGAATQIEVPVTTRGCQASKVSTVWRTHHRHKSQQKRPKVALTG